MRVLQRKSPPPLKKQAPAPSQSSEPVNTEAAKEQSKFNWSIPAAALSILALGGAITAGQSAYESAQEYYRDFEVADYFHSSEQCTLIVGDIFGSPNSHGEDVIRAAESFAELPGPVERFSMVGGFGSEWRQSEQELDEAFNAYLSLDGGEDKLDELIEDYQVAFVRHMASRMRKLARRGYENSTFNLSMGVDATTVSNRVFARTLEATESGNLIERTLARRRVESLFGVDSGRLSSSDENVARLEKRKLFQGIVDRAERVLADSSRVDDAREEWREAVVSFESGNNSVVLAGGNSGNFLRRLNGGNEADITSSTEFQRNFLEVEEVTSVGALQTTVRNGETNEFSSYTSESDGIDVWVDGSARDNNGNGIVGTSFSAPKTSVVTTHLHCENPEASSEEVEAILIDDYTRAREFYGQEHEDRVVDQDLVAPLVARNRAAREDSGWLSSWKFW